MIGLQEYEFDNIVYEIASLIDGSVTAEVDFWNFNIRIFVSRATTFSKKTLLHLYIVTTTLNHYHREFRKNGDLIEIDDLEKWYSIFKLYNVKINPYNSPDTKEILKWYEDNEDAFARLFDRISDEVFHVLFPNRNFLLRFNMLVSKTIREEVTIPKRLLTQKGTIKRTAIPSWVRSGVFHRDKGKCIFCNKDLTGVFTTLNKSNFDHIVPLDLHGCNDPCNLQLACETCNKTKSNTAPSTSRFYLPWWP